MIKAISKYLGSGVATAVAVLIGGQAALADPPRVEPREPAAVRETPREAGRDAARDVRADRRAHRAPGEFGLRLGAVAERGLSIANLVDNSAFYTAGIRPGDYIVSVNGHRIVAADDFDRYLYADGPDQPVQIVVYRNGADRTINLQPNVLYADAPVENYDNDLTYFGVEFDPQYTDRLVIRRVLPNSLAFRAGLRDGDEITTWHGERLRSPRQFAQVIHDEKPGRADFGYMRDSKEMRGDATFERREEPRTSLKPVTPNTREPGETAPNGRQPARDPIPTATPPAGREPIPTVRPPVNPREPMPTVTPPTSREPRPSVTPPAGREPSPSVTPPAGREPPRATPPAGREPPRAAPPEPANPPRPGAEAPRPGTAPAAPSAPREK